MIKNNCAFKLNKDSLPKAYLHLYINYYYITFLLILNYENPENRWT